jgi:S1-C subfamily serine protease
LSRGKLRELSREEALEDAPIHQISFAIPNVSENLMQTAIPCLFMRGGTSGGPFVNASDLLAGLGGGHPLTNAGHQAGDHRATPEPRRAR